MSNKGVFDQDFSEMVELDTSLDVNDVFSSLPANDEGEEDATADVEDPSDKESKKADVDENATLDVNKILESSTDGEGSEGDDLDDSDPASDNTNENSSEAPFTVIFAKDLMKQGLLSSFDEEEFANKTKELGEAGALRDLIKTEIDLNINTAKEDLDEGFKSYLTLLEGGFSQEDAASLSSLQKQFNSIKPEELENEENEALRKKVLTDYFKLTTQMPDSKIDKVVQRSLDLGEDVEDSKEYLDAIKDMLKKQIVTQEEENKNNLKISEQKRLKSLDDLKETINSISEIIPGQTINKQTKDKMYEAIIKPVEDKQGRKTNALWAKRAEDPMHFDSRLAYLLETGFFEKDKPWNKIKSVKTTKEVSDLEKYLSSSKNTGSISGRAAMSIDALETASLRKTLDATRSILKNK